MLVGRERYGLLVLLLYQVVYRGAVYPGEAHLLQLALQVVDEVAVELPIHQQHVVAAILGLLYVAPLSIAVGGVEVDGAAVLILLALAHQILVLFEGEILPVHILEEGELLRLLVELLIGYHPVGHEELEVVPLLLVRLAVCVEQLLQPVGHLLGDVRRDLLHVRIAL